MYINHISDKVQFWIKENVFTEDLVQSIYKKPQAKSNTRSAVGSQSLYYKKKIEIKPPTCGIVSLKL